MQRFPACRDEQRSITMGPYDSHLITSTKDCKDFSKDSEQIAALSEDRGSLLSIHTASHNRLLSIWRGSDALSWIPLSSGTSISVHTYVQASTNTIKEIKHTTATVLR